MQYVQFVIRSQTFSCFRWAFRLLDVRQKLSEGEIEDKCHELKTIDSLEWFAVFSTMTASPHETLTNAHI